MFIKCQNQTNSETLDSPSPTKRSAFGLLEVMISAMVLSISLLGIASIQSRVINVSVESGRRETAYRMIRQLSNIASTIDQTLLVNLVSVSVPPSVSSCYTAPPTISCTPEDFYKTMVKEWKDHLAQMLPLGSGCTCVLASANKPTATPPYATLRFAVKWTSLSGVVSTIYADNRVVASLANPALYASCPTVAVVKTEPATICNFS